MSEAYPLQWPAGKPRTPKHKTERSRFATSFAKARDSLIDEMRMLGAKPGTVVISTNITLRRDGLPYANQAEPTDSGGAVYWFSSDEKQMAIACDRWDKVGDNLHAISLTIQAMRGMARWGSTQMISAIFSGFEALPPSRKSKQHWWKTLDVDPFAPSRIITNAYLTLTENSILIVAVHMKQCKNSMKPTTN